MRQLAKPSPLKKARMMGKRGPKPYEPSEEQRRLVKQWAAFGQTQEMTARKLGIDLKTLRKHFRDELDLGGAEATAAVAGALFKKATQKDDTTAQIFWMKTRGGWSEKQKHEVTGADGGPIVLWGGNGSKNNS